MRVALVSESFLPQVNGVANSVRHVAERLVATGHDVVVVAPGPGPTTHAGVPVVRVRSVGLPGYRSFPVGLPDAALDRALIDFRPDVVHLASPILVGAAGLRSALRIGVPTVAVYQTDVAGFARQHGVRAEALIERWVGRIHRRADRTLVPSSASGDQLRGLAVRHLHLWRRGVSLDLFDPAHRQPGRWADGAQEEVVVGYVGRLAPEKEVRRLAELADLPGVRVVVVGDGPERPWLEHHLPDAAFTGQLGGTDLARAFASLDVFVHPGRTETFCQTVQEAQASGVAVVAAAAGGPLDLVDHGRTGLLFCPDDPPAMRRAVVAVARDRAFRRRLAEAGRREVQGRSWPVLVDELVERHYRTVVESAGRAIA